MRIAFLVNQWSVASEPTRLVGSHPELRERPHRWIRLVSGGRVRPDDVPYDLSRDALRDIVRRIPGGTPDVMVVWAPGYQALPEGIEEAPFPVVACYSDWPILMPDQAGTLDLYDYVFTCRGGTRVLRKLGYENCEYWPMYGHDPVLFRTIPGVKKDWDIGLIGNLSPVIQRDRAAWLARIAKLADRYRVRIAGGVFNEDYVRLMNATRITFNRTMTGAMNMRCYEAAACGSVLFCEEENEEIREFFQDRVHCVLYNEQNLEDLLDYYLTHEEERRRIAAAAVERVADFSLPRSLNRLAARLEELDLQSLMEARRERVSRLGDLPLRQARQAVRAVSAGCILASHRLAAKALEAAPDDPVARNDFSVVTASLLRQRLTEEERLEISREALSQMYRAVTLAPNSALIHLNLARMYQIGDEHTRAIAHAERAIELLNTGEDEMLDPFCLPFPFGWNEHRVEYSLLYNVSLSAPESFPLLRRCLLLHRAGMLLSEIGEATDDLNTALLGCAVAVAARGDLGSGHAALAQVLVRLGRAEDALPHMERCLETAPFTTDVWVGYAEALVRLDRRAEARRFVRERLVMLDALVPSTLKGDMQAAFANLVGVRTQLQEIAATLSAEERLPVLGGERALVTA